MQRTPRSFIQNGKDRKIVAFFWKERMPKRVHHIRVFFNKKNQQSSYGSPEQNMDPKFLFYFWAASLRCAGGQKVHI